MTGAAAKPAHNTPPTAIVGNSGSMASMDAASDSTASAVAFKLAFAALLSAIVATNVRHAEVIRTLAVSLT